MQLWKWANYELRKTKGCRLTQYSSQKSNFSYFNTKGSEERRNIIQNVCVFFRKMKKKTFKNWCQAYKTYMVVKILMKWIYFNRLSLLSVYVSGYGYFYLVRSITHTCMHTSWNTLFFGEKNTVLTTIRCKITKKTII